MDYKLNHKKSCSCGSMSGGNPDAVENSLLPVMLALLPCGLRNVFAQTLEAEFPELSGNEQFVVDGNLNYEKSFYDRLDTPQAFESLPDIFISSDINSVYHQEFITGFLNPDHFESLIVPEAPEVFKNSAYVHPDGMMCWFTSNLLVMVADLEKVKSRIPVSWKDLLADDLRRSLTLRGDDDFFCNAMLFPFLKDYGEASVVVLGKNTAKGTHPSQMVKTINGGNGTGTPLYVMPYSFALKIRNKERFKVIFPEEGPIVSPVQLMVKKGACKNNKALIDFLTGEKLAEVLVRSGFPAANATVGNIPELTRMNWIGWDFILNNDISECKESLQTLFYQGFIGGKM